jgi:nitrite reductase/ring-hydroxylating ferredoxin subunit/uncharacterized membrane protein
VPTPESVVEPALRRIEAAGALDPVASALQRLLRRVVREGPARDALTGRWLGHALHPMLTDLPIGFWTSAFTLDLLGGRSSRAAAQRLVGFGVLCAIPAAATGATDWSDTTGRDKRVGLVHAALNTAALACFTASWAARRRGRTGRGILWGLAGSTVATGGGYLGGHLVQRLGLGVDNTAFEQPPERWVPTLPVSEWTEAAPRRVDVGGAPVAVVRDDGVWYGLAAHCTHRGGPLDEGKVRDGCIQCPWHGSRFRLRDGSVARGPAAAPQPRRETRVQNDVVEVGPPPS